MNRDLMEKLHATGCPCYCTARGTCSVSCTALPISNKCRERFCTNDNFDSCALLLAHLLRHSQSAAGRYSSDLLTK